MEDRLRNFIRKRVADEGDAEDIFQDVLFELFLADRVEHTGAWLFRVARNKIVDWFRKKRPVLFDDPTVEDLLPSPDAGPEALYARSLLWEELEEALAELPEEQREVFLAHEIDGRSFKELSAETGVGVNTLLSRKRYAVLHLRERLKEIYEDMMGGSE